MPILEVLRREYEVVKDAHMLADSSVKTPQDSIKGRVAGLLYGPQKPQLEIGYADRQLVHIDLVSFLSKIVKRTVLHVLAALCLDN